MHSLSVVQIPIRCLLTVNRTYTKAHDIGREKYIHSVSTLKTVCTEILFFIFFFIGFVHTAFFQSITSKYLPLIITCAPTVQGKLAQPPEARHRAYCTLKKSLQIFLLCAWWTNKHYTSRGLQLKWLQPWNWTPRSLIIKALLRPLCDVLKNKYAKYGISRLSFFWVYNNCREHYVYLPTEKPAVFVWWTYALNLATCDI